MTDEDIRQTLFNELMACERRNGSKCHEFVIGQHIYDAVTDLPVVSENLTLSRLRGLQVLYHHAVRYANNPCMENAFCAYAWSDTHVYFLYEYNGDIEWRSVPRNPVDCTPKFGGRI